MTVKRQGSMTGSTTISQAGSVLTISAEGVAQITARIKTDTTNILTALNSIPPGTPHPTFTTLLSREYGAVTNVGGIAEIEVIYRGYTNPLPPAVWTVATSTGEEPIRTNPNWDVIKGIAEDQVPSGYITDENGAFVEFISPAELAGVVSFLSPRTIISRSYVTTTFPASDSLKVGQIDVPPSTGINGWDKIPNMISGDQSWLKISFDAEDLGGKTAYVIKEQWMKSDHKGWSIGTYGVPA
jgi:hypothetical protein